MALRDVHRVWLCIYFEVYKYVACTTRELHAASFYIYPCEQSENWLNLNEKPISRGMLTNRMRDKNEGMFIPGGGGEKKVRHR